LNGNLAATQSWVTSQGYLTSYTETDTLSSVTARGSSTSTAITINGIDSALKVQHDGTSTAWRGRIGSFNASADKSSFLGNYTGRAGVFGHNNALSAWDELWVNTLGIYGQGNLYLSWFTYVKANGGDTNYSIWHAGNLTNLNQLTNGPGYITGYTETDTLASVTGRGASTATAVNFTSAGAAVNLTGLGSHITFKDQDNVWVGYVGFDGNTGRLEFPGRNVKVVAAYNGTIELNTGVSGYNSGRIHIPYGYLSVDNNYVSATSFIGQSVSVGTAGSTPTVDYGIFHQSGVGLGIASVAGGTTQGISFWSHNGTSFFQSVRIAGSTGYVGINTTTPRKLLDVNGTGIVASFGGGFSPGSFAGLHFGYSESYLNSDNYKKSALVFERTDNHGQGGNASGKIHFLLNNIASTSANALTDSVVTIDSDASGTVGSVRMGIGTRNPSTPLHVIGIIQVEGGGSNTFYGTDGSGSYARNFGTQLYTFRDAGGNVITTINTTSGVITTTGGNSTLWNTAYGWGNHASQGYATQTYVNTAISNLVDAAPATLDTLNELAAALGDDPNFATTVATSIGNKVAKAGDTMTGNLNWGATNLGLTWDMNTDSAYIKFFNTGNSDTDSRLEYGTSDDGNEYHRWVISNVERMNLKTAGLTVTGNVTCTGTFTETSSRRFKENIVDLEPTSEKVEKLRPVQYNKVDNDATEIGLIAEEVAELFPELVTYNEDGQPSGVQYQRLSVILLKTIQEQNVALAALTERINKLENK
jgi:hypothetical protein